MSYSCPNEWKKVSLASRCDMAQRADTAVTRTVQETRRILKSANPDEPDLVRHFFLYGLGDIEDEWNAVLSSYNLRLTISGVFSHATPKVKPIIAPDRKRKALAEMGAARPTTHICELGDLLCIVMHEDGSSGVGNACMMQAKKGFSHSSDPLQRLLYEHANSFAYRNSTPWLNGEKRNLLPKEDTKLVYWDLTPAAPSPRLAGGTRCVFAADARLDDFSGSSFGDTLTQLVFGSAGTGFSLPNTGKAWGRIIGDLVTVTANRLLSTSPINSRGAKRGVGTDKIAKIAATKGDTILVRNSLADALRFLSEEDYGRAAAALERTVSLDEFRAKFQGSPLPREPMSGTDDDEDDSGITTVFIKCGPSG